MPRLLGLLISWAFAASLLLVVGAAMMGVFNAAKSYTGSYLLGPVLIVFLIIYFMMRKIHLYVK